jgi:hypothetical protein
MEAVCVICVTEQKLKSMEGLVRHTPFCLLRLIRSERAHSIYSICIYFKSVYKARILTMETLKVVLVFRAL